MHHRLKRFWVLFVAGSCIGSAGHAKILDTTVVERCSSWVPTHNAQAGDSPCKGNSESGGPRDFYGCMELCRDQMYVNTYRCVYGTFGSSCHARHGEVRIREISGLHSVGPWLNGGVFRYYGCEAKQVIDCVAP